MAIVDKAAWIASVVSGRTFADVGGLWGTVNEMASPALLAGAAHATMIDIQPPGNEWWQAFETRMKGLNLTNYSCLHADATADAFAEMAGAYDVIHCSGIIYHLPDPFSLILRLRKATRRHLVLTSMYIPEQIANAEGELNLDGGQALLMHAMTGKTRQIVHRHYADLGLQIAGLTVPLEEPLVLENGLGNTSPWWWLMTPSLLTKMLECAGLEVIDRGDSWEGRSHSFFCKVL
jgi:hypothetical protein